MRDNLSVCCFASAVLLLWSAARRDVLDRRPTPRFDRRRVGRRRAQGAAGIAGQVPEEHPGRAERRGAAARREAVARGDRRRHRDRRDATGPAATTGVGGTSGDRWQKRRGRYVGGRRRQCDGRRARYRGRARASTEAGRQTRCRRVGTAARNDAARHATLGLRAVGLGRQHEHAASTESVIAGYISRQIPVGAVIIDSPWETTYNTLAWDTTRYPSPAGDDFRVSRRGRQGRDVAGGDRRHRRAPAPDRQDAGLRRQRQRQRHLVEGDRHSDRRHQSGGGHLVERAPRRGARRRDRRVEARSRRRLLRRSDQDRGGNDLGDGFQEAPLGRLLRLHDRHQSEWDRVGEAVCGGPGLGRDRISRSARSGGWAITTAASRGSRRS